MERDCEPAGGRARHEKRPPTLRKHSYIPLFISRSCICPYRACPPNTAFTCERASACHGPFVRCNALLDATSIHLTGAGSGRASVRWPSWSAAAFVEPPGTLKAKHSRDGFFFQVTTAGSASLSFFSS